MRRTIDDDRYPMAPRLDLLKAILAKLYPAEPLPAGAGPSRGRCRRRLSGDWRGLPSREEHHAQILSHGDHRDVGQHNSGQFGVGCPAGVARWMVTTKSWRRVALAAVLGVSAENIRVRDFPE